MTRNIDLEKAEVVMDSVTYIYMINWLKTIKLQYAMWIMQRHLIQFVVI